MTARDSGRAPEPDPAPLSESAFPDGGEEPDASRDSVVRNDSLGGALPDRKEEGAAGSLLDALGRDDDGRIGIFPSWRALYIAVVVYTAGLIALLFALTVLLDTSVQ